MSWGFFKIYDWIASIKTPAWMKCVLKEIQDIIVSTVLSIGKEYLKGLEEQITIASEMDIPNKKKFEIAFKWGKDNIPNIKDNALSIAIEVILAVLKKRAFMEIV